jgi:hypothetical protein
MDCHLQNMCALDASPMYMEILRFVLTPANGLHYAWFIYPVFLTVLTSGDID